MRWLLLLVVALSGCQFTKDVESIPCTGDEHCPDDYWCPDEVSFCRLGDRVVLLFDEDGDGFDGCATWPDDCPEDADCDDADASINPGVDDVHGDGVDKNCDGIDGVDEDGDGHARGLAGTGLDCDDEDPTVHPDAEDVCGDEADTDCDGADEIDDDGDGFEECNGDCDDADSEVYPGQTEYCDTIDGDCDGLNDFVDPDLDLDGDGSVGCGPEGDCDDEDDAIYPGATEICNGIDDDCVGGANFPGEEADDDGDGFLACEECDDGDSAVSPGAVEICNGKDDDCVGGADFPGEEADDDGDGSIGCEDCDDTDATTWPGAPEVCDGLDNDCDGAVGGGEVDVDADGFLACIDCADSDPARNPAALEVCNGLDDDCDGVVPNVEVEDGDGDGIVECEDCDDANNARSPLLPEVCDGVDNDCDGLIPADENDGDGDGSTVCEGDCEDGDATISPLLPEACDGLDTDCSGTVPSDEVDVDGDGALLCEPDCDDGDPALYPGAPEGCDGIDTDCDGVIDATESDDDGDGLFPCEGDCDDGDVTIFDGAPELCDGIDNACAGSVPADEGDVDGDGALECEDCDDGDAGRSPLLEEDCGDGIDNDCSGLADDCDEWIVFASDRDGGGDMDIWAVDLGLTTFIQLTDLAGDERRPVFSPSGLAVAFQDHSSGKGEIAIVDVATLEVTVLTDPSNGCAEASSEPDWHPDGDRLVFSCQNFGSNHDIAEVTVPGAVFSTLVDTSNDSWAADWSSDGLTLIHGGSEQITLRDPSTGAPAVVALTQDSLQDTRPDWSPTDDWFVWTRDDGVGTNNHNLHRLNIDGTNLVDLTTYSVPERAFMPRWAPDGQSVLYTQVDAAGHLTLRRVGVDGTGDAAVLEESFESEGADQALLVSGLTPGDADGDNDGVTVLTDCDDTDPTIYPGALELCWDGADNDCNGVVDDCEEWLVFTSDRDGNSDMDLWITNVEQSIFVQLTDQPGNVFSPVVSPGGDEVAFSETSSGLPQLAVVDLETLAYTQLTDVTNGCLEGSNSPDWHPDGDRLVYTCQQPGDLDDIAEVTVPGGIHSILVDTSDDSWGVDWNPAGTELIHGGNLQITLRDPITGTPTPIASTVDSLADVRPDWSPTDDWFTWTRSDPTVGYSHNQFRLNLDGTDLVQLTSYVAPERALSGRWSPDGQWVIYTFDALTGSNTIRRVSVDGLIDEEVLAEASNTRNPQLARLALGLTPGDADGDGFSVPADCDDGDDTVYPGAAEICDGVDHNCDGLIDDSQPSATTYGWDVGGPMSIGRDNAVSMLLTDGTVLVAGGRFGSGETSAEIFDPYGSGWTPTIGSMDTSHYQGDGVPLPGGEALVVGGGYQSEDTSIVESYDASTGNWLPEDSLQVGRKLHTATLLASGDVLVVGGIDSNSDAVASVELFEPSLGTWRTVGPLDDARQAHTATLLPSGEVLVVGGTDAGGSLATAELYDPVLETWSSTGGLTDARSYLAATLLPTGDVLVAGGSDGSLNLASTEVYDPSAGTWTLSGAMDEVRASFAATVIAGRCTVVVTNTPRPGATSSEYYNVFTGTWSAGPTLNQQRAAISVQLALPTGEVLVAGGNYGPTGATYTGETDLLGP